MENKEYFIVYRMTRYRDAVACIHDNESDAHKCCQDKINNHPNDDGYYVESFTPDHPEMKVEFVKKAQ